VQRLRSWRCDSRTLVPRKRKCRRRLSWRGLPRWSRRSQVNKRLAILALLLAGSAQLSLARPSSQTTFPSPEDASRALLAAVQQHDERALTQIVGAGTELLSSDDKVQDTLERERFVQKYQEMHRLVQEPGGV